MWNARFAEELARLGLDVTLPQRRALQMLMGTEAFDAKALFAANRDAIVEADVVLAILDQGDADSGTCWECGYAYSLGRPIVGLRTDFRSAGDDPNASVNLMLSQSCEGIIQLPAGRREDLLWVANQVAREVRRVVTAKAAKSP